MNEYADPAVVNLNLDYIRSDGVDSRLENRQKPVIFLLP